MRNNLIIEDLKDLIEEGKNLCVIGEAATNIDISQDKFSPQFESIHCRFDMIESSLDELIKNLDKDELNKIAKIHH